MNDVANHHLEVISAMRSFEQRLDEIVTRLDSKRFLTSLEKADLQALITPLKAEIKAAAKRMKVKDNHHPQTSIERNYFAPAMQQASANFNVAKNSNPITSNWISCLMGVQMDISYLRSQLEQQYPAN